jgi:hypothetical protein
MNVTRLSHSCTSLLKLIYVKTTSSNESLNAFFTNLIGRISIDVIVIETKLSHVSRDRIRTTKIMHSQLNHPKCI